MMTDTALIAARDPHGVRPLAIGRIKRSDGQEFIVRPAARSPLDVGSVTIDPPLTADEIVAAVRAGRERHIGE